MNRRNKILTLLIVSAVVDLLFTAVQWDHDTLYRFYHPAIFHGWGNWDGRMTLPSYVYHYCEHVSRLCMALAAYLASRCRVFLFYWYLEFADMIDFAIHYNHTIFMVRNYAVEFNHFKILGLITYIYLYGIGRLHTASS